MKFGHEPEYGTVTLTPGQDFVHRIDLPTGKTVPASTTVALKIYDQAGETQATWPAIAGTTYFTWNVASEVSDTITGPARFRIYAHYSDGMDLCWYLGAVAFEE